MSAEQLLERARRIRLPITTLADRAGVNLHTAHRLTKEQTDARCSTMTKVMSALEAEERDLLAHLSTLHGTGQ